MDPEKVFITGSPEADDFINRDGTALLIGMLLDQQIPMAWAFRGPSTLSERLGHLDPTLIGAMSTDAFTEICCRKPAIHRFPAVMARRIHELCITLTNVYDGEAERIWNDVSSGAELYQRLIGLPGFADEKAKIFIAILGKRHGLALPGWRKAAGTFGDDEPRSVADCFDEPSLAAVRQWKKQQKESGRDKQDRPL
jgi:uncharacterized HhH-GPD family protein